MMKEEKKGTSEATLPATPEAALYDEFQKMLRQRGTNAAALVAERLSLPLPASLPDLLAHLTTLKGWLDSFRPLPAVVVDELQKFYTVSLTYNSNAIEGNTLSQHETEMVLAHGITVGGKTLVEHLEVIGHRDAMLYMEQLAEASTPLGEWEIKSLHSLILAPVDKANGQNEAGRYRTLDVRAAGTGHTYPAHFQVPDLMGDFVTWLESEDAKALHPVEYSSQAHYKFVTIHPFRDGNGRAARLLMNLLLVRSGYPITVLTNALRAEYIDSLVYAQSHEGDARGLTHLVAGACRESFDEYLRILATAGGSRGRGAAFYRAMREVFSPGKR